MNNQIAAKIRKIRKEKGITQLQMAEHLHIDISAYTRLETGVTSTWAKYLENILSVFELTPEKFFEDIGSNIIITNQQGSYGGNANVEHLHAENCSLFALQGRNPVDFALAGLGYRSHSLS